MKEIMPLYSRVLLQFYEENPYEQKTTESGLKLTNDVFESPDTGNLEKKDFFCRVGNVIEAGPDCKYLKVGDDVIMDTRNCSPLRFMGNVFFTTAEQNIIAVINDDLTERFKK